MDDRRQRISIQEMPTGDAQGRHARLSALANLPASLR